MTANEAIQVYGADWCGDYRRTKQQLIELDVGVDLFDVEADADAAATARRISGQSKIPVVAYPDGTHQVEPSNPEVETKLRELSIL